MSKKSQSADELPWVDVFSGAGLTGQLHRLRASASDLPQVYNHRQLPRLGSIIVGPGAIADFKRRGASESIRLSPRTILWDASHLMAEELTLSLLPAPKGTNR